jgi:transposase InsO family protein
MTPEQKVSLVEAAKDTYGLNRSLAAAELPKSTWYYHLNDKVDYEEKYRGLKSILEESARQHPEYGRPRIMAELRKVYDCTVNHKVVERLLRLWDLRIIRGTRQRKPSGIRKAILEVGDRANLVAQIDEIGLFQVVYTDFTELLYANGSRKAVLMSIIGHTSKLACGWAVGETGNTKVALRAWNRARETLGSLGIPYSGMIVHHDRDPVYTGYRWTSQLLLKDEVRLSYALGGAKDNPEMESFNGRFKMEGESLFSEVQTLAELRSVVAQRMQYYNAERRHSSLDHVAPLTFIARTWSTAQKRAQSPAVETVDSCTRRTCPPFPQPYDDGGPLRRGL